MTCSICDQKPMNCDCTSLEKTQHEEIERLTDAERDALATVDQLRIENARLRNSVAGYTEGISAGRESKVTLTDAEREAVERAAFALNGGEDWSPDVGTKDKQACVTIRNLLERLK